MLALLKLHSIRRLARANPEVAWAANYAHMIQASLATYLVTGAFLSVAYFDLAYQLDHPGAAHSLGGLAGDRGEGRRCGGDGSRDGGLGQARAS